MPDETEGLRNMDQITMIVNEFLRWPLPDSVSSDQCATVQGYPHRTGTNLLTANEARQMFEYILGAIPRAESRFEVAATNAHRARSEKAERELNAARQEILRLQNVHLAVLDVQENTSESDCPTRFLVALQGALDAVHGPRT
jgi:hypothetical protein